MSISLVVCGLKSSILPRNRPSRTVEVVLEIVHLVLSFNIVPVVAKVLGKVMQHRSISPLSWDEVVVFIFLIQFCILHLWVPHPHDVTCIGISMHRHRLAIIPKAYQSIEICSWRRPEPSAPQSRTSCSCSTATHC